MSNIKPDSIEGIEGIRMGKKGHFGVSMGSVVRVKKKVKTDPAEMHCSNCKFMYKGSCKKLSEISNGQMRRISDKRIANKCKFFQNKHNSLDKVHKSTELKKKKPAVTNQIPIGAHSKLYKVCRICGIQKHFTEFQSKGGHRYAARKSYCRECKVTGKVPGKSGDPKLLLTERELNFRSKWDNQ